MRFCCHNFSNFSKARGHIRWKISCQYTFSDNSHHLECQGLFGSPLKVLNNNLETVTYSFISTTTYIYVGILHITYVISTFWHSMCWYSSNLWCNNFCSFHCMYSYYHFNFNTAFHATENFSPLLLLLTFFFEYLLNGYSGK